MKSNMAGRYILKDHIAIPTDDIVEWGQWFESADRHVAKSLVGDHLVSTVFLGIDHQWFDGPPILFETMIFGPGSTALDYQTRCSTWAEALEMHEEAIHWLQSSE
jgi:hypothetical protein